MVEVWPEAVEQLMNWNELLPGESIVVPPEQVAVVQMIRHGPKKNEVTTEAVVYWLGNQSHNDQLVGDPIRKQRSRVLSGNHQDMALERKIGATLQGPSLQTGIDGITCSYVTSLVISNQQSPHGSDYMITYAFPKHTHAMLYNSDESPIGRSEWLQFFARAGFEMIPSSMPRSLTINVGLTQYMVTAIEGGEYELSLRGGKEKKWLNTHKPDIILSDGNTHLTNSSVRLIYLDAMNGVLIGDVHGQVRIEAA